MNEFLATFESEFGEITEADSAAAPKRTRSNASRSVSISGRGNTNRRFGVPLN